MIDLGINLFQEIAALGGGGGGYSISNSLRFNDNDSAYLTRTPASAGNRKTWTWSGWVKRGNLVNGTLFHAGGGTTDTTWLDFGFNGDRLRLSLYNTVLRTSTAVLRDSSGWYHIVVHLDTTQSTASNRVKIYLNGVEITVFDDNNNPTLNGDYAVNTTTQHNLGRSRVSSYFDGYLAEINFIDGQALTADDFGQIDATTGEWSPKKYSGTYGTNGFYLEFKDGAALGDDTSGNTNDWTPTNLASTDQMLDTPTNNFAVLNPLDNSTGYNLTLAEGNLKCITPGSGQSYSQYATMHIPTTGKWYFEYNITQKDIISPGFFRLQLMDENNTEVLDLGYAYSGSGVVNYNGFYEFYTNGEGAFTQNQSDIIGISVNRDTGMAYLYRNGVLVISGDISSTTTEIAILFVGRNGGTSNIDVLNFGQDSSFAGVKTRQGNTDANGIGDFYYTPPTGYLALCTDNLPEPAIVDSETQFNVVTYTGDGTTSNPITVGFQPDFVWIKRRDAVQSHVLSDSVRGAGLILVSDASIAEVSEPSQFVSFDSSGFTVGTTGGTLTNASGSPYVAWCWKAGGTAVTNTDGSITSQVSANVDSGFSIVSYTGNGTGGATVGHGLTQAPEMVIVKRRNNTGGWLVYNKQILATKYLALNLTIAETTLSTVWNNTEPTSSVFSIGTDAGVNGNTNTFIAYCFHSVDGFSKFGSYVGNGSTNGPFVYTGFRPAFLMVKRTDSTSPWLMYDNERNTFNQTDNLLRANTSQAETGSGELDFLSNGFKYRGSSTNADYVTNVSGGTYIYMAFAEAPFKNAVAR